MLLWTHRTRGQGNFKCVACNDGGLEADIIRDLFTANMSNDEVQKDLLAETKSPKQALDYAIKREKGLENQIHRIYKYKTEPVNFVQKRGGVKSQPRGGRNRGGTTSRNNTHRPSQNKDNKDCFKCGNALSANHLAQCPARDKICNKCTKRVHFEKLCKSSEMNAIQENIPQQQELQETDTTAYVNYLQAGDIIPGWELIQSDDTSKN